jgi:hypothetical protein
MVLEIANISIIIESYENKWLEHFERMMNMESQSSFFNIDEFVE